MNRNQTNTTYVELLNDVGLSVRNYTLSVMRNPSKHIPNRFNDDSTAYECALTDLKNERTMEFSFYKCLLNSVEVGIVDKPVSIRTFDALPSISEWLNEPIRVERSEENLEPSM